MIHLETSCTISEDAPIPKSMTFKPKTRLIYKYNLPKYSHVVKVCMLQYKKYLPWEFSRFYTAEGGLDKDLAYFNS